MLFEYFNTPIRNVVKSFLRIVVMNAEGEDSRMVIGYFGVRAKAQVCRLLCEYLELPYRDQYFTPE